MIPVKGASMAVFSILKVDIPAAADGLLTAAEKVKLAKLDPIYVEAA
jgi:hypothetical protein